MKELSIEEKAKAYNWSLKAISNVIIRPNQKKLYKTMSKRQQEKMDYIAKHADIAMQSICKSFHKDIPNHLVTAGYRWGFDDGYKWYMNHPIGVLDEDYAWAVYNFINDWKAGKYGEIELQKAIRDNFKF